MHDYHSNRLHAASLSSHDITRRPAPLTLTIVVQIPRNADRLRSNPLGIYVNAISWSRELRQ